MFDSRYEIFIADNDTGKDINYQIRYQVYCLDQGFEDPATFPALREQDGYDKQSVHFLVRCRETGQWVGAARLVIGTPDQLPMRHAGGFDGTVTNIGFEKAAELSRLCVIRPYRHRYRTNKPYSLTKGTTRNPNAPSTKGSKRSREEPEVLLGLIRAARAYGLQNGIPHLFFLIAPSLARILLRLKFHIHQIGPECNYRGIRFPYFANLPTAFQDFLVDSNPWADMFRRDTTYRFYSELTKEPQTHRRQREAA